MPYRIFETSVGLVAEEFEYVIRPVFKPSKRPSKANRDRTQTVKVFRSPEFTNTNPGGRREYLPEGGFESVMREAIAYNRANPGVYTGLELARVEDASDRAQAKADALRTQEFLKAIAFEIYWRIRPPPRHNAGRKRVLRKHRVVREQDLF